MRAAKRVGRTVVLRLRFDDFSRASRSHTLGEATAATATILVTARGLLRVAMPIIERRGLTLLGVTVANLDGHGGGIQLALPLDCPGTAAIDAALDEVRERFGPAALTRAVLLGSRSGLARHQHPESDVNQWGEQQRGHHAEHSHHEQIHRVTPG
jgi:DNA polymerase-4